MEFQEDVPKNETQNRRTVLKAIAGAAAGGAAVFIARKIFSGESHHHKGELGKKQIPLPSKEGTPNPELEKFSDQRNREINTENLEYPALNKILSIPPFTDKRRHAEETYVDNAHSWDQIDKGFRVIIDPTLRKKMLDRRNQIRMGNADDKPDRQLTPEYRALIEWAKNNNIHPEVVALCKDYQDDAAAIIEKLKRRLQPNRDPKSFIARDIMLNIGGLSELIIQETGDRQPGDTYRYGFINEGNKRAKDEINPSVFPQGRENLVKITNQVSKDSGLAYNPDYIPGSARGSTAMNVSGGAIGPQIMPDNAIWIYDYLKSVDEKFNPWDLRSGIIGMWVYLANRAVPLKSDLHALDIMLGNWNRYQPEIDAVKKAALDFEAKFPGA